MEIPIEQALRDARQIALARLQDAIVESLFEVEPKVVLHGGTAIWRCYGGKRFSEDVNLYATDAQVDKLNKYVTWSLSKRNAKMEYPTHSNRIIKVSGEDAKSKFEAMKPPSRLRPVQREYSKADGSKLFVNTLSVDDFIAEKVSTYKRRGYVRDMYDIYQLVVSQRPSAKSKILISDFIKRAERPIDEQKLRDLVYVGLAPGFDTMVEAIKAAL